MNRNLLFLILIISSFISLNAQSGALIYETGTPTINASAILEVISTDKGILIPRMTTAERDDIAVAASEDGLLIFNTDNGYFEYYRDASTGWATIRPGNEFVEGTGQGGQVSFWTGSGSTSTITGDDGLFYDVSNTFLGINNPSPSFTLDVGGNLNSTGAITASSVSATSVTATSGNFTDVEASGTMTAPFGVFDNLTTNSAISSATIFADYISSTYGIFGNADVEGLLTSNTVSGENFRLEDSETDFYINFETPDNLADNYSLTFPIDNGDPDQFLQTDGNGNLVWADLGLSTTFSTDNVLDDSGNINGVYYNNSGTLTSSDGIFLNNSTSFLGINNSSPSYSLDVDGQMRTGDSDTQGAIIFGNGNNANETWLVSSTLTSSPAPTFTLPVDSGNDGDYLTVDANGNLIWTSPTAQDDFVVDNSTGNNARQIAFFEGSNTISGSSMSFTTDGDLSMSGGISSSSLTTSGDITSAGTVSAVTGSFTNLDINNSLTVSQISLSNADGGVLNLFSTGSSNVSMTFPSDTGTGNQFLQTDGSGNLSWADPVIANESITFTDTDNGIAFNNSGTLSSFNGIVVDNSNTFLGINNSSPSYSLDVDGQIRTGDSDTQGAIIFGNGNNANETWLVSSTLTSSELTIHHQVIA